MRSSLLAEDLVGVAAEGPLDVDGVVVGVADADLAEEAAEAVDGEPGRVAAVSPHS